MLKGRSRKLFWKEQSFWERVPSQGFSLCTLTFCNKNIVGHQVVIEVSHQLKMMVEYYTRLDQPVDLSNSVLLCLRLWGKLQQGIDSRLFEPLCGPQRDQNHQMHLSEYCVFRNLIFLSSSLWGIAYNFLWKIPVVWIKRSCGLLSLSQPHLG